jgi:hypothetical protein
MNKVEFLKLLRFPMEWDSFGMYPDELLQWQMSSYRPGHEDAAEHDRNGAFHWWLKRQPSKVELAKLLRLAALDPDPFLGNDLRAYIRRSKSFDVELSAFEKQLFAEG